MKAEYSRHRPEVDKFRHTLYDHLEIDRDDYEVRDFIHEMAHNLYNQAYMKAEKDLEQKVEKLRSHAQVATMDGFKHRDKALREVLSLITKAGK